MPQQETKEWTLMFYFASDNPLAPSIIPQLKSIKQAGYHPEVNVIAQFDPQPEGTPTHIFDVNLVNKLIGQQTDKNPPSEGRLADAQPKRIRTATQIGFSGLGADDPFVSNLIEDKLWSDEVDRDKDAIRHRLQKSLLEKHGIDYNPPMPSAFAETAASEADGEKTAETTEDDEDSDEAEPSPRKALRAFLNFCAQAYPARHYILFILGHGVVVGNDIFLFDEHADQHSLTLEGLGAEIKRFNEQRVLVAPEGQLELISFHSCSVSSLEVAYELKGKTNYMLGSQGPAFVGSWPYRQILMRLFSNAGELAGDTDVESVKDKIDAALRDVTAYCFHNSKDFLLAGYSFDVTLCDLTLVSEDLTKAIRSLKDALIAGLGDTMLKNLILLAHLEAQSEWEESYTDLHDFCLCLARQCVDYRQALAPGDTLTKLDALSKVCGTVTGLLAEGKGKLVAKTDFVGPEHQYSHGLSVYFPWAQPLAAERMQKRYQAYQFQAETDWLEFLNRYFTLTQRKSHNVEKNGTTARAQSDAAMLSDDIATLVFKGEGRLSAENTLEKTNENDRTGGGCTCTIKNYPRDTRDLRVRRMRAATPGKEGEAPVPLSQDNALAP